MASATHRGHPSKRVGNTVSVAHSVADQHRRNVLAQRRRLVHAVLRRHDVGTAVVDRNDITDPVRLGLRRPRGPFRLFSVRWTSFLVPELDGPYSFSVQCDDSATVYVDNLAVAWSGYDGTVAMSAGRPYSMRVDHVEMNGLASCFLYWAHATFSWDFVPQRLLWSDIQRIFSTSPSVSPSRTSRHRRRRTHPPRLPRRRVPAAGRERRP